MTMGGMGTVNDASVQIKARFVSMMVVFTLGYALGWVPMAHILSADSSVDCLRHDLPVRLGAQHCYILIGACLSY